LQPEFIMKIAIVSTGTELLRGAVVNTDLAEIGRRLLAVRAPVACAVVAGDSRLDLIDALAQTARTADVLIVTGGLGSTEDDRTRDVAAEFFGRPLVRHAKLADNLRRWYRQRHGAGKIPRALFRQADVPEGAEILPNSEGSAPGLSFTTTYAGHAIEVFLLPGPPHELVPIFETQVLPRLTTGSGEATVRLLIEGAGELELEAALDAAQCPAERAYCAIPGGTKLFLTGDPQTIGEARKIVETLFPGRIADADTPAEACVKRLAEKKLTLGLAESCTGGLIAGQVTSVPGASQVFMGGIVAYDNCVKQNVLGVPEAILREHGAVSEPCAAAMAEGAARVLKTDLAGAVTGIAGPGGGTPEKPVGLVWIAVTYRGETATRECRFRGGRETVRLRTAAALFELIRERLNER